MLTKKQKLNQQLWKIRPCAGGCDRTVEAHFDDRLWCYPCLERYQAAVKALMDREAAGEFDEPETPPVAQ